MNRLEMHDITFYANGETRTAKVCVDGRDISALVTGIKMEMNAGERPVVQIELAPDEVVTSLEGALVEIPKRPAEQLEGQIGIEG